ncbi:FG-GAP-like repeat-containing protein, partial [Planctomycetota bacterium]
LAVANLGSADVSILLGNGNGSFAAAKSFAAGPLPFSLASADLNADGNPDLAIASSGASYSRVTVLLGIGDGTFVSAQSNPITGNEPLCVAIGDLNGDAKPDLVTANSQSNNVSVLLNTQPGQCDLLFAGAGSASVGRDPRSVAVGDLNGDGKPDLATAGRDSDTVSVLLGHGNGQFTSAGMFAAGDEPRSIAMGDLNRDDKQDVVVCNSYANMVTVLFGNGDGTLSAPTATFAVGDRTYDVAIADFNSDGNRDLVTTLGAGSVAILRGNGDGTFDALGPFAVGHYPSSMAIGDVNGDGPPDVVVSNHNDNVLTVLLGNGDGTLSTPKTTTTSGRFRELAIGDVNGDGKLDVATIDQGQDLAILLSKGDGTFDSLVRPATGINASSLVLRDLNNDGLLDLGVARGTGYADGSQAVWAILGNGDGTFYGWSIGAMDFRGGNVPYSLTDGDFNGDGNVDLVTTNSSDTVSVALGKGNGRFYRTAEYRTGNYPRGVAICDVNGDGQQDLVTADTESDTVSVLLGRGDGTVGPSAAFGVGQYPRTPTVADFNRDGYLDVATANANSSDISILLGYGNGSFAAATHEASGNNESVAAEDVNRDGSLDLVVSGGLILLGDGDGDFAPGPTFTGGSYCAVSDLNHDGWLDLLVGGGSHGSTSVGVLLGTDNGTFLTSDTLTMGPSVAGDTTSLAVGDFDRDGNPDFAIAHYKRWAVGVVLGRGDGTFRWAPNVPVGSDLLHHLSTADFNSDGNLDLGVVAGRRHFVSIFLGNGDGTFSNPINLVPRGYDRGLAIGDLNGDGMPDLATTFDFTHYSPGYLSVMLQRSAPQPGLAAAPRQPTGLVVDVVSETRVDLHWDDNSTAESGFRVERKLGGGAYSQIAELGTNATAFVDTSVSSSKQYSYRVSAYNANGQSAYSDVVSVGTEPVPEAPTNLVATAVGPHQVYLTWTDNSGIETRFRIERRLQGTGTFSPFASVPPNATGTVDAQVDPATSYEYRVIATNQTGDSPPSNVAAVTTPPVPPSAPDNLTVSASSPTQAKLTWADNSDNETGFRVERSPARTAGFQSVGTVSANVTTFTDTSVDPATVYYFRVAAFSSLGGASAPSKVIEVTTPAVTQASFSVVPDSGPTSGGTPVLIIGSGFETTGVTTVSFGGAEATQVTVHSAET